MNDPESNDAPRQPTRRFQISMRTLLAAVTTFALWLGFQANSASQQRKAVAALEEAGVKARYYYEYDPKGGYLPEAKPPYPDWLVSAIGIDFFAQVKTLECHSGELDEALVHCAKLSGVTNCLLGGSRVSDEGLRHIAKMRNLERLGLEYTGVTNAGLMSLTELRTLKAAFLMGIKVSDETNEALEESLPNCEVVCDPKR